MTYQSLKESGKVFNLQLSETMLRYYQVNGIPINAHCYALLTGITSQNASNNTNEWDWRLFVDRNYNSEIIK